MRLYRADTTHGEVTNGGSGRWFTDSETDLFWYWKLDPTAMVQVLDLPDYKAEMFRVSNLPEDHLARVYSARPDKEFFIDDDTILRGQTCLIQG